MPENCPLKSILSGPVFRASFFLLCLFIQGASGAEFVFEQAPFESCHASTLIQTKRGLLVAWFGGSHEGAMDVKIWGSRLENNLWSKPFVMAQGSRIKAMTLPTWNPVLFQPAEGPLMLFYKEGLSSKAWRGMMTSSTDEGLTWSRPQDLDEGMLGPIRNKPLELTSGRILYPSSVEGENFWQVHVESSDAKFKDWQKSAPINSKDIFVIQPTLLSLGEKKLLMLMRSSRLQKIMESRSEDEGKSWSVPKATSLPNPNSAIDAVRLKDKRIVLVYNNSSSDRSTLDLAVSKDDGKTWVHTHNLEKEAGAEFSYPSVIVSPEGLVQITYTWKRQRIKFTQIKL